MSKFNDLKKEAALVSTKYMQGESITQGDFHSILVIFDDFIQETLQELQKSRQAVASNVEAKRARLSLILTKPLIDLLMLIVEAGMVTINLYKTKLRPKLT